MSSKVYFTTMKSHNEESLVNKLERLVKKAGIESVDFNNKYVAIKLHFGEPGNLSYLRPQYVAKLVDIIKEAGGKPFLTDCNTLYVGGRKNAVDHIESAYKNGFVPYVTGAHVIIADGIKGTDEALVPVPDGEYVKEAKIGKALMDADIVISFTHFKGHEATGFGGALKNLGMGGGSRAGKMEQHSAGKPYVDDAVCIGCGKCVNICAHDAVHVTNRKSFITEEKCVGCGRCIGVCPVDAIQPVWNEANDVLNKKIAEYTAAIVRDRPCFHISLAVDVSPVCDCHASNDIPIVPDIGMFASFDPVALDKACADAVNAAPVQPGSVLSAVAAHDGDYFKAVGPETHWQSCLEHGEKLGLGTQDYELVEMK